MTRPGTPLPIVTVTMLLAAGCLGGGTGLDDDAADTLPVLDDSWAEAALSFGQDHDHADITHHHNLTTPNFEIIGHQPMVSPDQGATSYYFPCGDAKATSDGRRLAIVESSTDIAFGIADVTDPTAPEYLGELIMRTTAPYDVALVPDGRHVVMVTELPKTPDEGDPVVPMWRSPCAPEPVPLKGLEQIGEELLPRPNQLLLINIEDPAQPVVVDQRPLSGVGHGVSSDVVDGRTWVAVAAWGAINALGTYQFYEIDYAAPGGPTLSYLSTYNIPPSADVDGLTRSMGHNDVWIVQHPITNQVLAWMAHWHHGVMIVDLTDPTMPREIGHWTDFDPARPGSTGGFHSLHVLPYTWGDRHFIVTGPELGSHPPDQPTGTVWVLETTNPTDPRPVGAWTLPHEVEWTQSAEWSGHYLTVVNKTAFITMYHGGVWAMDLSGVLTQDFTLLPSVGVFVPDLESPSADSDASPWAPMLGEVHAFEDGSMVTFEATSGLYAFRFNQSMPIASPEPWPITPPPAA